MEKIILFCIITIGLVAQANTLEQTCLACHKREQIPSELIYKRYLMNFSSQKRIEREMFLYLKNPQKSASIMPAQFFLRFPMKSALTLDDDSLKKQIKAYIENFDIKKKIRINR